jgi:ferredoxin
MTTFERFLPKLGLQMLIDELRRRGYVVAGPTISEEAITYDAIDSVTQLPAGWTDEQAPGSYRLKRRDDEAWFGYVVGPHSWKRYLFPPHVVLTTSKPSANGWTFSTPDDSFRPHAFLGVRACELAAIRIQDKVFLGGPYQDPIYRRRREQTVLIAVNCTQAASTCFCVSMETGPRCQAGFDLALTELADGFVCEVGTDRGRELLDACATSAVEPHHTTAAATARQQAVDQQGRHLDTEGLPELLAETRNHPHWKEVGDRCLSCTNCTMVCPTCFCMSVDEVRDLTTGEVNRERKWDSCFHADFTYMNGGVVRTDTSHRYRQWLTHKLGTWHAQFGTSGCVGCGRCITWCPVGIDLVAEVAALRAEPQA